MEPRFPNTGLAGGIALGLLRAVLLWVTVPLSFIAWLLIGLGVGGKYPLRKFLHWVDYNITVTLCRTLLRPLMNDPQLVWLSPKQIVEMDTHVSLFGDFF